jgi:hypothetical protein
MLDEEALVAVELPSERAKSLSSPSKGPGVAVRWPLRRGSLSIVAVLGQSDGVF